MAIKGVAITVTYLAWDTSANTPKTGDVAQHTMRVITDGTAAAADNSPAEVENGEYKLLVSAAEMTGDFITVEGSSATADIEIMPVRIVTEQGVLGTLATPGQVATQVTNQLTSYTVPTQSELQEGFEDLLHTNWTHLYADAGGDGSDGSTWAKAYTTIQAALNAASDETIITVSSGTYGEAITVANNNIILRTIDYEHPTKHPGETCIITGAANTPTATITGDDVQLLGFTVTDHTTGLRDGIYINGADKINIDLCEIRSENGQLRDGINTAGNSNELTVTRCHIHEAERYGIHISAQEDDVHIVDTIIGVTDGATAAFGVSANASDVDIQHCDLHCSGTVANGIVFGANSSLCRALNVTVSGFTALYDDAGSNNYFVNVTDVSAHPDGADWTSTRAGYIDNISGGAVTAAGPTKTQMDNAHGLLATPADVASQVAAELNSYGVSTDTEVNAIPGLVWVEDLASIEAAAKTGTQAGHMLAASRAGIAGRLAISGTTVTLYEVDGTTIIWTATLDNAAAPTSRTTPA